MNLPRLTLACAMRACALLLALAPLASAPAFAGYPERPVRMMVGLQAGASTDILARKLASRLGERLGKPFVVENRPGAGTRIAMEAVIRAPADGYTLGVANAVTAAFPMMFDNFGFVPGQDFVPIAVLGRAPSYLAVRATLPVKNVQEFVAYARANSGKLSFGQGSTGSNPHLSALALMRSLGVQAVDVPYKGNAPTAVALAAGEIDFAMLEYPSVRPLVERGNVRLLAVIEPKRMALMPDVPTGGEQGLTREIDGLTPWFMLVAPAGTPPAVVALLNKQVNEALKAPDVKQSLLELGIETEGGTAAEALAYFTQQRERVERLARELKVVLKTGGR
ncbi:Bug family tripartite tricarboxylate transporter substrate binding protein [Cupriavidus taiwanensis]|uniref:Extra-cytoplasmic solute receptor family protein 88 n=1 Tax=Cupriavidus taiwanensis TaxID=164546 RepID=A0A975X4A8_9BURK|nr:Extra-cytoplasmic solute receptor family protein 88 [Cupriavidus taiwanensis]